MHPLNYLMCKSQPFVWTPECQASFDMLHSQLTNTPIVQLPDPNKPYLLFTDARKCFYSSMLTQASTEDSLVRTPWRVWNLKHRTSNLSPMLFTL